MFGFRGGFLVDFFGPFSLGKLEGKNPPKNPPKNPRFSRKLFDQNPLREISALMFFRNRNRNRTRLSVQTLAEVPTLLRGELDRPLSE